MTERPIPFSAPMVRALLASTKTQTRRVMARQKRHDFTDYTLFGQRGHPDDEAERRGGWAQPWVAVEHAPDWPDGKEDRCPCPYAKSRGDRLWVREAWRTSCHLDDMSPSRAFADLPDGPVRYEADGFERPPRCLSEYGKLRPGMFMPRCANRILLEVTAVRVERLQDISEADARAEGCQAIEGGIWWTNYSYPLGFDGKPTTVVGYRTAKESYRSLWESINGPGSWDANPWVWVVEFKRIKP